MASIRAKIEASIMDVAKAAAPTSFRGVLKVIMGIKHRERRMEALRVLAFRDHPESQVALGEEYEYSPGLPNYVSSLFWYRKASENGSLDGKYKVSTYYYWGLYVDRDRRKAFEIVLELATLGHIKAQSALAECYLKGDGIPRDTEKGTYWMTHAAAGGSAYAISRMASYNIHGYWSMEDTHNDDDELCGCEHCLGDD